MSRSRRRRGLLPAAMTAVLILLAAGGCRPSREEAQPVTPTSETTARDGEDAHTEPGAAEVVFVEGDVRTWTGDARPAQPEVVEFGASLLQESSVSTAAQSSCELELANDSVVTVRPDTVLRLDRMPNREDGSSSIRLVAGSIGNRVGALVGGQRYDVRVRGAVLGVRGTAFDVAVAKAREGRSEWLEVRVSEGTVVLTTDSIRMLSARLRELGERPEVARLQTQIARTVVTLGAGGSTLQQLDRLEELETSLKAAIDQAEASDTDSIAGIVLQADAVVRELVTLGRFLRSTGTTFEAPPAREEPSEPRPDPKPEAAPEPESQPESQPEPQPESQPEAEPATRAQPGAVAMREPQTPPEPLVQSVSPERELRELGPTTSAYSDHDVRIEEYPSYLEGALMVAQSNTTEDRDQDMSEGYLTLTVGRPATVVVACEPVGSEVPAWIDYLGFQSVSATVRLEGGHLLELYRKDLSAGETLSLGGNRAGVTAGYHDFHYVVFVTPQRP